jgi:sulfite exporter TauE/SafE
MPVDATYISAFLVGFLGGVHCVGMCGGVVGALTLGLPDHARQGVLQPLPFLLTYNLGRIVSYGVAGMLFGGLGDFLASLGDLHVTRQILLLLAGLFMIILGLYLADWWRGLARVERMGVYLWQYIEPLGRHLLPVRRLPQALLAGLVWGWLPCGLVYSILIWSMAAGSWYEGGLLMLSFGLGTLPNLLLASVFAAQLATFVRSVRTRHIAGGLVILFGAAYAGFAIRALLGSATTA